MKKKKLCIYIFRHGQTYYNKNHYFTGWKNSVLTPKGIKDAKKIGERLKKAKFEAAFQTTLSRSKDTLKYVLKHHPECKWIYTDNRMIERSYGNLEGKSHKKIIEKYGKKQFDIWHRSYDIAPPKGESLKDVEKRVYDFIKQLIPFMKKYEVNAAISAHGNSMRPFRKYFEKLSNKEMVSLENPWDNYFVYEIIL